MSKTDWLKILHAQRDMIRLQGTAAHAEAVRIVREMKEKSAFVGGTTRSAS